MAKAKSKAAPSAILALSFAEITGMKQDDRLNRFKLEAEVGQRAFAAMGKLFRVIEANLKKTQGIYPALKKLGVKPGTISNASYAARVFDLVDAGKLTEAEFDTLAFNDCYQIARVTCAASKKRLTTDEVVLAIREGGDFAEDFKSLYELGITSAEKIKAEKDTAAREATAKAEAKAKADKDAADLAEARKESEDLKAQLAQAQAGAEPAPEPVMGQIVGNGEVVEETEIDPNDDNVGEVVPDEPHTDAAPTITKSAAVTAQDVLPLLDEVELAFTELTPEDQQIVAARLIEMASRVVEAGITPSPEGMKNPPAPKAKKGKKAVAA